MSYDELNVPNLKEQRFGDAQDLLEQAGNVENPRLPDVTHSSP